MEINLKFIILIILNSTWCLNGYRILLVFLVPGKSHYFLGNALARGLAETGNDVTMMGFFEEKHPPMKGTYRDIVLNLKGPALPSFFDIGKINEFLLISKLNVITNYRMEQIFNDPNFQKLINSNETFDAVIIDQYASEALKAVAYHFKAPLILFGNSGTFFMNNPVGNPSPPSYVPHVFSYTSEMSFCQRLVNSFMILLQELNRRFIFIPEQNKIMMKYFPDSPDLDILEYNSSLILLNSHESVNQAVPHVPSMIDIGGFHIKPPKELPKDLKYLMGNAKEGVVYFSMGSNIKPSEMTQDVKQSISNALGKLKQKVLWKWDEDTFPGLPKNVILSKWYPQQDILAHPNTKLFINHGGLLSTIETIYHGVPILAIPVFGDQKLNAARATHDGYGLTLSWSDITENSMTEALNELLENPKYTQNAKKRSAFMHDRPIKPLDLAVYWIEFVAKHRGAPHLRVAGLDLPWYKYFLLDVLAFVCIFSLTSVLIVYLIIRKICFPSKTKPKFKRN